MEKTITNKIIKSINKAYQFGLVSKRLSNGSTSNTGEPDIFGSVNGIRIEIEVKQPGKRPSKLQLSRLRKLQKANIIAFWADDHDVCMLELQNRLDAWQQGFLEDLKAGCLAA